MNELLSALLLGLLEGLTEFLPISSTGHLLIAQHWLGARSDLFNIAIQAGAIVAVCLAYRARLWAMARGCLHDREQRDMVLKLGAAFAVTAVVGIPVRLLGWELPDTVTPIAWALVLGGVAMLWIESRLAPDDARSRVTWTVAIVVGLAQVLAGVFPGVSRSAAAIFAAMLAGLGRRAAAADFAFLLAVPTMFAATAYAVLEYAMHPGAAPEAWDQLGLAFVAAAASGYAAVRWLLGYVKSHRFTPFALYRIALGLALLLGLPAGA